MLTEWAYENIQAFCYVTRSSHTKLMSNGQYVQRMNSRSHLLKYRIAPFDFDKEDIAICQAWLCIRY